eukprot:gb/GECG01002143.1/.p1 GENE.gb/GECG01002143.1/~~gb/GECG01002143.1/.p1  ORF type:complete len:152 (+),score=15.61 gb/GECG01002143.1/:1-456(+)
MTAVYGIIVYNGIVSALILHNLERRGDQELAKRTQRRTEVIMLFAVPAITIALLLDFEGVNVGWSLSLVLVSIIAGYAVSYLYDYKRRLLPHQIQKQATDSEPLLSTISNDEDSKQMSERGVLHGATAAQHRRRNLDTGYDEGDVEMHSSK